MIQRITKIIYGKYMESRKGVKARILKTAKHAEWTEVDYDKPDRNGFQGAHFEIKDALDFEVGDFIIGNPDGTFTHQKSNKLYPWWCILLALSCLQPEVQVIRDCDGCMIEDCDDCNFDYIEREAERKDILKRFKERGRLNEE